MQRRDITLGNSLSLLAPGCCRRGKGSWHKPLERRQTLDSFGQQRVSMWFMICLIPDVSSVSGWQDWRNFGMVGSFSANFGVRAFWPLSVILNSVLSVFLRPGIFVMMIPTELILFSGVETTKQPMFFDPFLLDDLSTSMVTYCLFWRFRITLSSLYISNTPFFSFLSWSYSHWVYVQTYRIYYIFVGINISNPLRWMLWYYIPGLEGTRDL